jgi:hypothetical protein
MNLSKPEGVVTINMNIKAYPQGDGRSRLFERGQQYYHFGSVTTKVGCTPCGTAIHVPFWVVVCDGSTYHIDGRYSSVDVMTGPIPSLIDRVNNLGDGYDNLSGDSPDIAEEEERRRKEFKLRM